MSPPAAARGRQPAGRGGPSAARSGPPTGKGGPAAPVTGLGPRLLAYELLRAVEERDAYANLLMPQLLAASDLSERDRALATELGYGTLRWQGTLDAVLGRASSRPLAEVDPPVRTALRLGAYQLLQTRIAVHAAVGSTVDLVRATSGERPVRFANAVLRGVARAWQEAGGDVATASGAPSLSADAVGHLSLVHAHPRWIVTAFLSALDGDLTETAAALAADNVRPTLHLVARPGLIDRDALLEQAGPESVPGTWSPYSVYLPGGDPGALAAIVSGAAAVQDEGSQLVALLVEAAAPSRPGQRTVDLCAGPGGKAALLASLAAPTGGPLIAIEPRLARAQLVRAALRGQSRANTVVLGDGRRPPLRPGSVDRILVDAPCSGLGALRRRPEARWRKSAADLPGLTALQGELLDSALRLAAPGGTVVYATCSPHRGETDQVVDAALRRISGTRTVREMSASDLLGETVVFPASPISQSGTKRLRLWPNIHATDGMFAAVLRVE
jgi:16S rRNA (cytosine967-C5)-methyltransferase